MISDAVSILRRGGLVAFPTETVYGLGADATSATAVRRIFAVKGRPATNPLIVHVASVEIARPFTMDWPAVADQLARQFWPGPLTLVLRKTDAIVDEVSAGGTTVGLRVPNHPLALELLTAFNGPVAAPSANRSNHISPTDAAHVRAELGEAVDLILDGGPCAVGIESTVLDLAGDRPRVLRPGCVSRAQIEAVIGPVDSFSGNVDPSTTATSPGQHQRHYSPRTPALRFHPDERNGLVKFLTANRGRAAVMATVVAGLESLATSKTMPANADEYARAFYRVLRDVDAGGFGLIFIEWPPGDASWDAVRDRIRRATKPFADAHVFD